MNEDRKTCQICGRPIKAKNGMIAHHGYQRPGTGWQTSSCEGARELPLEVSDRILERHLIAVADLLQRNIDHAAANITEVTVWEHSYKNYQTTKIPHQVTEANFDEIKATGLLRQKSISSWEGDGYGSLCQRERDHRNNEVKSVRQYLTFQQERFDNNPFRPY